MGGGVGGEQGLEDVGCHEDEGGEGEEKEGEEDEKQVAESMKMPWRFSVKGVKLVESVDTCAEHRERASHIEAEQLEPT